ncbi:hypothetical protein EL84_12440 [Paenibacillus sp. VT-400]|uniref:hypothetical protein n=1 Tax=Paenibacillus sp. VT-400 TaxID=1495853 RepID=UPI00064A10AD|nr:hypothetical protein [Paenibacillus sp. VT-400]KLU53155.1 hypothetical protein EL84_12440 [Paenibacillus sp. VT-400]
MSLASDFNRQERWKEKSEDKRAPRLYHPRAPAVYDKAGMLRCANAKVLQLLDTRDSSVLAYV